VLFATIHVLPFSKPRYDPESRISAAASAEAMSAFIPAVIVHRRMSHLLLPLKAHVDELVRKAWPIPNDEKFESHRVYSLCSSKERDERITDHAKD
jgi:hypothetical protein